MLLDTFYHIRAARVCSCALWMIGEYCLSLLDVESGIATINQCLGDLSFFNFRRSEGHWLYKESEQANSITVSSKRPAILIDGMYATQSAASETTFSPQNCSSGIVIELGITHPLLIYFFILKLLN
ncbi:unnamed protein product [Fraxinus pennsylvanica]|uniref:Uncharacterized protein n=1 Tax=Fraxinus pennsylvanica TaxID=56036 RepID=A0AAD1ZRZ0_9LAMI|nr:unnamed protein product [Fraxinus pennsylvanica]